MDVSAHSIKTYADYVFAPKKYTKQKTTGASRYKHEQTLSRVDKPPLMQFLALGELLSEHLKAVDLTSCRKTDRFFLFPGCLSFNLLVWECYIAKYP